MRPIITASTTVFLFANLVSERIRDWLEFGCCNVVVSFSINILIICLIPDY